MAGCSPRETGGTSEIKNLQKNNPQHKITLGDYFELIWVSKHLILLNGLSKQLFVPNAGFINAGLPIWHKAIKQAGLHHTAVIE